MSLPRRRGPPEEDPNLPPEEDFPPHAIYGLPPGPPLPMEAGMGYDPNAAARMGRGYMDTRGPPLAYYPRGPPMGSPYMSGGYALGPPGLEGYAPHRGMAPLVMGPDELTLISPQAAMLARQQAGMRGPRPGPIGSGRPSPIDQLTGAVEDLTLGVPEAAYPHPLTLVPPPLPLSTRAVRFPRRPGMGTLGRPVKVKANHFLLEILPRVDLFQYDCIIAPDKNSRGINRAVMKRLVEMYRGTALGGRLPVYDGRHNLYTAGQLPFQQKEFTIVLQDEADMQAQGIPPSRSQTYSVVLKLASRPDMENLQQFLRGRQAEVPHETLHVLDIVLREQATQMYTPVGRSFYTSQFGRDELGDGVESWRGFYQSLRPTQLGLSLNLDMSATAFLRPIMVTEYIQQICNMRELNRGLTDAERLKAKRALRGVRIEVTHRGNMRRKYRINGLTNHPVGQLTFKADAEGTLLTVAQYFWETYNYALQFPSLPALEVGNPERNNYLPMEVCKIVEGQRYVRKLNERQITRMLQITCQRPHVRAQQTEAIIHQNRYSTDEYCCEFDINIQPNMMQVQGRILPPPKLMYSDTGKEREVTPSMGAWNMMGKKVRDGGRIATWGIINFAVRWVNEATVNQFARELVQMCTTTGMQMNSRPAIEPVSGRPELVARVLATTVERIRATAGRNPDILMCILPENNGSLYGDLKRICEVDLGVVTQCCLSKHLQRNSKQYLANVALKINVKIGGRNALLSEEVGKRLPLISDLPTIVFGADVTHPHPGEESSSSIAAVVASKDWPYVSKYACLVRAQEHRQEIIQDLFNPTDGGMIVDLLRTFYINTGVKPLRIIFYRDGVSEGQFHQVLLHELDAVRKACAYIEADYQPPVTFIVVQKRHHTRLYPTDSMTDRSGNIVPGTVVDSSICHPTDFDFFLCSHAGIQGTSRPAHYYVLWDENQFTANALQQLTYNLCYTYARCTRSVSIVPPAYYAHLAAFRARFYAEADGGSDSGSRRSGAGASAASLGGGGRRGSAPVKQLPELKDPVKRVMFYC